MKFFFAIVMALAWCGMAYGDTFKVTNASGETSLPVAACAPDVQEWVVTIAKQRPTVIVAHDVVTLELGQAVTISDRSIVTPDLVLGFWDSPPWSDQGATLVVRIHPKPGKTSAVELILIQRHSITDRADACYVEWRGIAEKRI